MPYMSPAAMGWSSVRSPLPPSATYRAPRAARTASGQPKPLDELTDTVAPAGTSLTASSADRTGTIRLIGQPHRVVSSTTRSAARDASCLLYTSDAADERSS